MGILWKGSSTGMLSLLSRILIPAKSRSEFLILRIIRSFCPECPLCIFPKFWIIIFTERHETRPYALAKRKKRSEVVESIPRFSDQFKPADCKWFLKRPMPHHEYDMRPEFCRFISGTPLYGTGTPKRALGTIIVLGWVCNSAYRPLLCLTKVQIIPILCEVFA